MAYGIARGDVIVNVIEAESEAIAQEVVGAGVEIVEDAQIGWTRTAGAWGAPEVHLVKRALSGLEFEIYVQQAAGLTDAEVITMLDDPQLRLLWSRLQRAQEIVPDHPLVADGLDALEALGYLTEEQREAVTSHWPVA